MAKSRFFSFPGDAAVGTRHHSLEDKPLTVTGCNRSTKGILPLFFCDEYYKYKILVSFYL
jgi:hypothetical protein